LGAGSIKLSVSAVLEAFSLSIVLRILPPPGVLDSIPYLPASLTPFGCKRVAVWNGVMEIGGYGD